MSGTAFVNSTCIVTGQSSEPGDVHWSSTLVVENGRIEALAEADAIDTRGLDVIDCAGGVLTPGFVDSHTHAVFASYRAGEYALRSRGASYMEIARAGGGILASVRDLRALSEDALVERTLPRLREMLALGTTTAEVKSGYGLDTDSELRMLRVIARLNDLQPIDLIPTFLGAHAVPEEFSGRSDAYVDLLVEETIPAVADAGLARFCDVFMEPGVFDRDQALRVLTAGSRHGLVAKLHADELEGSGGAELAAEVGAASADHLAAVSDTGIARLASAGVVATLLPATMFFLGRTAYAPARRLMDAGVTIALATDFNPGTAPSPSMPLVLTMACSQMGLVPLEAIHAATAGGARALRLDDGAGTLGPGAPADLVLWECARPEEIPYRFGRPPIHGVWKAGERVC